MRQALIGIDPKSRVCEIVGRNSADTLLEIQRTGLIAVPTSTTMARTLFGKAVSDIFTVANHEES